MNKRVSEDDTAKAMGMDLAGSFLGRQSSQNGKNVNVVQTGPQTSSSQMIFGKRPPEARGNRNKILSAGGSSNTFYKSAMLNNANNRNGAGAGAAQDSSTAAGGASTNLQEFYSPRPQNNNGVGELKTSKSGERDDEDDIPLTSLHKTIPW